MTDFPSLGRPNPTGFAHTKRREVVVQHERVPPLAFQGINNLCIPFCPKRTGHDRLGLSPGKEGRTVRTG